MNTAQRKPTPAGHYVEVLTENKTGGTRCTVYGPFPTADAARRGRFFSIEQAEFNAKQRKCLNLLFNYGTYDEGEIDGVLAEPKAFGYTSYKVKPASALKRAAYWAELDRPASEYPEGNLEGHASFADFFFHDLFVANFKREPVL